MEPNFKSSLQRSQHCPTKRVYIMSGPSGSGKSTWANLGLKLNSQGQNVVIVSADHFFVGDDGVYRFNPRLLGAAHDMCRRNYWEALDNPQVDAVVVDNTNTRTSEINDYVVEANRRNIKPVTIVRVICDVEKAVARNSHGVPAGTVRDMWKRCNGMFDSFERNGMPPGWQDIEVMIIEGNV